MSIKKLLKSVNLLFLLKVGIGSAVSILLAESIGLLYSPSAGIITLLTIQNTKKETIALAIKRMVAFFLATGIIYLLFQMIGYTAIAFGGFVIIFVALCFLFDLKEAISMNAVLMTHFLIEKRMDIPLLLNEISLLLIGMGIGIVINLIMPRYRQKIRTEQHKLEEEMKMALYSLGELLRNKDSCLIQGTANSQIPNRDVQYKLSQINAETLDVQFHRLEHLLEELLKSAYEDAGNTLLNNTRYLVSYLEMRKLQIGVLKEIRKHIDLIPVLLNQTFPIADFFDQTAESFHEMNNVIGLLTKLEELHQGFKKDTLPITREEFEYRAILYQILKDMEYFLMIKRNFILELEKKNMKSYWS